MDIQVGDRVTYKYENGTVCEEIMTNKDDIEGIKITLKELEGVEILKIERPKYEKIEEKKEILDETEKKYLLNIIKPFKSKVQYIKKCVGRQKENYIYIDLYNDEYITLPYFEENTMYKGMEGDKKYTLKELGLEE